MCRYVDNCLLVCDARVEQMRDVQECLRLGVYGASVELEKVDMTTPFCDSESLQRIALLPTSSQSLHAKFDIFTAQDQCAFECQVFIPGRH